jgi:hypothetical protein
MSRKPFRLWQTAYREGQAVLNPPSGVRKAYQLSKGVRRLADWPPDVKCQMDDEFPDDLELADSLHGAVSLVISRKLKEFLEARGVKDVEYLPLEILNHKGRRASKDYFIFNPNSIVDCIDIEASGIVWNNIDKDSISSCESLVLDAKRVPDQATVFRLKLWPEVVVIDGALAAEMADKGFSGLHFVDPKKYIGI